MSQSGSESDVNSNSEDPNFIGSYVGERSENGQRDGTGKAVLPNRNQYSGEYRDGVRYGTGVLQYKIGARYEGEWKNGMKQGEGKFNYPDGSWYFGKWCSNKKNGFGKYEYANGDFYEGNWKDDVKHGVGNYKYAEANVSIKATWHHGELKGPIEVIYPDSCRYHGHWKDSSPIGEGAFSFDMKYLLTGHFDKAPQKPPSDDPNEVIEDLKIPPKFRANEIKAYDVEKLPPHEQNSVSLQDSADSICGKSLSFQSKFSDINEVIAKCVENIGDEPRRNKRNSVASRSNSKASSKLSANSKVCNDYI